MSHKDVVVAGAGAIGLAIAWRSAERGASVTVVDPSPGSGASSVAAGMLAPVTEFHHGEQKLLRLNLNSAEMFPAWISQLEAAAEMDTGYRRCGTVMAARDADDIAALRETFAVQQRLGATSSLLRSAELRSIEPALGPHTRGGIEVPNDHQVEPAALTAALLVACERLGVSFMHAEVQEVKIEGGVTTGITTSDGKTIFGKVVVIAAGARSGEISGLPPGVVNVRPVKGQLVELLPGDEPVRLSHNVRGLDVYLVPRSDGRVVVGATVEEKGWDPHPTAGAAHDLLRYAYELVPGITEMRFGSMRVGFRPGTPDNAPLLGPTDVDGLVLATGHFRNGVLLTPITADRISAFLDTGTLSDDISPFLPGRSMVDAR
jgi:glycine oxidase